MKKELFIAKLIISTALFLGGLSMTLFVVFLFNGALNLVDFELTQWTGLAVDGGLCILFFIQHSWMIRQRFRARLSSVISSHYHDAVFTMASGLVLTAVVLFWQSSNIVVLELHGAPRWAARGVFFLAILGMWWGGTALKSFDPFGRTPIRNYLRKRSPKHHPFTVIGPYLWVRHPLYFFSLLLIWSCPVWTLDRLLFNLLWTLWIVIGTVLEEKDLVIVFGDDYRHYQENVPMLIPWKGRGRYS